MAHKAANRHDEWNDYADDYARGELRIAEPSELEADRINLTPSEVLDVLAWHAGTRGASELVRLGNDGRFFALVS